MLCQLWAGCQVPKTAFQLVEKLSKINPNNTDYWRFSFAG